MSSSRVVAEFSFSLTRQARILPLKLSMTAWRLIRMSVVSRITVASICQYSLGRVALKPSLGFARCTCLRGRFHPHSRSCRGAVGNESGDLQVQRLAKMATSHP